MPASSRDRFYSAPPASHNLAMQYGWSPTAAWTGNNGVTGNWVPLAVDASGFIQATIANAAFSGELNVDIPPVTAVTGINNGNISGYAIQSGMLQTNGVAVVTSGYNPQFASGQKAPFAIDNTNGGELVVLSDLDRSIDSVTTYPANATTASNYVPSGSLNAMVTGNVLLANPNRIAWGIQNVGSGSSLYLKFGTAPAGSGNFNMLLRAATADFGSDGGSFIDSPAVYLGDVSISGSTRFSVWEM